MKKKLYRYSSVVALAGVVSLLSMPAASADITYVFTPEFDLADTFLRWNVVGSGAGNVDISNNNNPVSIASNDWDVENFETNFMVLRTGGTQGADTESGTFANVTSGASESIISFAIDEDGAIGFDNDIDFDTENVLAFNNGDEYTFSLLATFEASTLAYDDLIIGTHIDYGQTNPMVNHIAEEGFGITTVVVIPEPSTMLLALASVASLGVFRRR